MSARSTWFLRGAAVAGLVALAAGLTPARASENPSESGSTGFASPTLLNSGSTRTERFRSAEIISGMLAQREATGSPFLPPGQGGVIPGRPHGRPVGGNPDPGTPPGKPEDRPPDFANNDQDE